MPKRASVALVKAIMAGVITMGALGILAVIVVLGANVPTPVLSTFTLITFVGVAACVLSRRQFKDFVGGLAGRVVKGLGT